MDADSFMSVYKWSSICLGSMSSGWSVEIKSARRKLTGIECLSWTGLWLIN